MTTDTTQTQSTGQPPVIAVVIPAYNEIATMRAIAQQTLKYCDRVVIVDDGSSDGTADSVADLDVTLIRHNENQGKAASLWDGMRYSLDMNADAVITMDADGQHSPADIPTLIAQFSHNADAIIIGARLLNRQHAPRARLFANEFADFWVSWAAGHCVYDSQSGFRLYPTRLIAQIDIPRHRSRGFVFESEFIIESARKKFHCISVPINSVYHSDARPSHFRPVMDITRIVIMIAWKLISRGMYLPGLFRVLNCKSKMPTAIKNE